MQTQEITHGCGARAIFPEGQTGNFCMQVWGLTHVSEECPIATVEEQTEAIVDLAHVISEIEAA